MVKTLRENISFHSLFFLALENKILVFQKQESSTPTGSLLSQVLLDFLARLHITIYEGETNGPQIFRKSRKGHLKNLKISHEIIQCLLQNAESSPQNSTECIFHSLSRVHTINGHVDYWFGIRSRYFNGTAV